MSFFLLLTGHQGHQQDKTPTGHPNYVSLGVLLNLPLSIATYDTPAFDKDGWPEKTQLAWPIFDVHRFSDVNRALLLEAGAILNLTKYTATRLMDNLCEKIVKETKGLYEEVQAENKNIAVAHPNLSATLAGESRCLRAILYNVIQEMTKKLSEKNKRKIF